MFSLIVSDSDFTNNFTSIHLQLFYPNDTYNLSEPSYILYSSQTTHYNKAYHFAYKTTPLQTSKAHKSPHSPYNKQNLLTKQAPTSQASPLTTSKPTHKKPSPPITTSKNLSHKSQASPLQQANPLTQSQASPPTASTPNAQKTLRKRANPAKYPQYSTL